MIRLRLRNRDGHEIYYAYTPRGLARSTGHVDIALARRWVRNVALMGRPDDARDWIAAARRLVRTSQKNARTRHRTHTVGAYDVLVLLRDQGYRCAVSGVPLEPVLGQRGRVHPWAPSLDQRVAGAGYCAGNVRIVCNAANYAMHNFGEDALFRLADYTCRNRRQNDISKDRRWPTLVGM